MHGNAWMITMRAGQAIRGWLKIYRYRYPGGMGGGKALSGPATHHADAPAELACGRQPSSGTDSLGAHRPCLPT